MAEMRIAEFGLRNGGAAVRALSQLASGAPVPLRVAIVAAHPDDETIGAGSRLPLLADATLIYVTDGAPHDRRWWGAPEMRTREEYARARREELRAALALAGTAPEQVRTLGIVDQEASFGLAELTNRLLGVFTELRPDVVLTHPYEGGHPDHDAAAFAVQTACGMLEMHRTNPPAVLEFTSYHAGESGIRTGEFLPGGGSDVVSVPLSATEQERKRRMVACFATQQETLRSFPVEVERFRAAPGYDFSRPPHAGPLFYENFDWGTTGDEWRARAREALDALGLAAALQC